MIALCGNCSDMSSRDYYFKTYKRNAVFNTNMKNTFRKLASNCINEIKSHTPASKLVQVPLLLNVDSIASKQVADQVDDPDSSCINDLHLLNTENGSSHHSYPIIHHLARSMFDLLDEPYVDQPEQCTKFKNENRIYNNDDCDFKCDFSSLPSPIFDKNYDVFDEFGHRLNSNKISANKSQNNFDSDIEIETLYTTSGSDSSYNRIYEDTITAISSPLLSDDENVTLFDLVDQYKSSMLVKSSKNNGIIGIKPTSTITAIKSESSAVNNPTNDVATAAKRVKAVYKISKQTSSISEQHSASSRHSYECRLSPAQREQLRLMRIENQRIVQRLKQVGPKSTYFHKNITKIYNNF
ncbi:hypothetical protein GJ496_008173 [Pomphorhynchus laevis]|nr:hypothetical protein GJ496_008173 [Pomphorhynchus laevis]